ncbi:tetratricopeptide repeat protein [Synechococcales cyanobacterium C]|uniref:Tetratricopeptide repeat protein n=1 Tax=Petrachloros mirabilis ULC683 TaxID=2781853 RepID=A0A8K2A6I2_9CYAN|nr:trypsin-like peptidase domain-containing protein [Petrachloros mirabilis]NCJ05916.1 tetratricopeptide repeat protein [Petrachloros mirabilis ULC683]
MRLSYGLTAALIGTTIAMVQPYSVAWAQDAASVNRAARDTTVFIQGVANANNFGSGVIIAKSGNSYTVLTAAHVVTGADRYTITTPDSFQYSLQDIQQLPNLDLAVVKFESSTHYAIAKLGDSNSIEQTNTVYVAGYPKPGFNIPIPSYTITDGRVTTILDRGVRDGYALAYSNPTRAGMSGGPVFNERGEVVAIHGRKEGELDGSAPIGAWVNLGIPINQYKAASGGAIARNTPNPAQQQAEAAARQQAELVAQQQAEAAARQQAELVAQQQAEAAARQQAELVARQQAEAAARQQAELVAQQQAEAAARQQAELVAQQQAEAAARQQAELVAQQQAEAAERQQAELVAQEAAATETRRQTEQMAQQLAELRQQNERVNLIQAQQDRVQPSNHQAQARTLLASIKPYEEAMAAQPSTAPVMEQQCQEVRINTIVRRTCTNVAAATQLQQSAGAGDLETPEAYANRGNSLVASNKLEEAIQSYTRALSLNSNYAVGYFNRGLAYYKAGQMSEAIADFTRASELFKRQGDSSKLRQTETILQNLTQMQAIS